MRIIDETESLIYSSVSSGRTNVIAVSVFAAPINRHACSYLIHRLVQHSHHRDSAGLENARDEQLEVKKSVGRTSFYSVAAT